MSKVRIGVLIAVALAVAAGVAWWLTDGRERSGALTVYGNVDLRQVDLPFNASERVIEVLAQEGDHVNRVQVVARPDATGIQPEVAKAEADVAAQQQVVNRMHAGSRPAEIAQARANVLPAQADSANARRQYDRLVELARNS